MDYAYQSEGQCDVSLCTEFNNVQNEINDSSKTPRKSKIEKC